MTQPENTTTSISITRAIVELKTLDKRIQKSIDTAKFVGQTSQFVKPKPEVVKAPAQYQSIRDLLNRRKKLKSLIVSSNAVTQVTICGEQMTVAEAIETKSSIKHLENLLKKLQRQYADEYSNVEHENQRLLQDLERKTQNGEKNSMEISKFSKDFMDMHGVKLYDPINAKNKIDELESYITQFQSEVDFVLSEKNSTTFIQL